MNTLLTKMTSTRFLVAVLMIALLILEGIFKFGLNVGWIVLIAISYITGRSYTDGESIKAGK